MVRVAGIRQSTWECTSCRRTCSWDSAPIELIDQERRMVVARFICEDCVPLVVESLRLLEAPDEPVGLLASAH